MLCSVAASLPPLPPPQREVVSAQNSLTKLPSNKQSQDHEAFPASSRLEHWAESVVAWATGQSNSRRLGLDAQGRVRRSQAVLHLDTAINGQTAMPRVPHDTSGGNYSLLWHMQQS